MLANINLRAEALRVLNAGRARLESLEGVKVARADLEGLAEVVRRFVREGHQLAGCEPDLSRQDSLTPAQPDAILADLWLTAAATLGILEQTFQDKEQAAQTGTAAERRRRETEALLFGGQVAQIVGQWLQELDACGLPLAAEVPSLEHLPTVEQPPLPAEAAVETPAPPAPAQPGLSDTLPDTGLSAHPDVSRPGESDHFEFVVPAEQWEANPPKKRPKDR